MENIFKTPNLGDFAFANGCFSNDVNFSEHCYGVVAWLNPNKEAPVGLRGLIVSCEVVELPWSTRRGRVGAISKTDGLKNFELALKGAPWTKRGLTFPAMRWCQDFCIDNIPVKGGFLPALLQLELIEQQYERINVSLKQVEGARLFFAQENYMSSTEYGRGHVWCRTVRGWLNLGAGKIASLPYVRCAWAF